jgi:hypothetical protein
VEMSAPSHSGEVALHLCGGIERVADFSTWEGCRQAKPEKGEASRRETRSANWRRYKYNYIYLMDMFVNPNSHPQLRVNVPSIQSKAPFTALLIIAPPIRHTNDLATAKEQKHQKQVKVISSVKRRSHKVVIPRPQLASIPECPIHDNEATNKGRGIASTDVPVEVRDTTEEDSSVPKAEFQLAVREFLVQGE